MSRLRTALLAGFIASSAWMFCALLFNAFTNDTNLLDKGGRASIAWIGVAFLAVVFLITLLIANSMHHSAVRRRDRKALRSLEKERVERADRGEADQLDERRLRDEER